MAGGPANTSFTNTITGAPLSFQAFSRPLHQAENSRRRQLRHKILSLRADLHSSVFKSP